MSYRFAGKQKLLALGVYPAVTLAQARKRRDEAREHLARGIDPGVIRRAEKVATRVAAANTFEAVAREFHAIRKDGWSPRYAARWIERMEKDLFPHIGRLTLPEITAPILLDVLRRIERRGANETAHTLRQTAGQVFRYGVQTGRCARSPVPGLHGALKPLVVRHMSAVLEPAKAMKRRLHEKLNGRPHFVPLAPQAIDALATIRPLTGHGRYVFPSLRSGERPMSDNAVNAALRRMGFTNEEMTAHGFRAMARTLLTERLPGISADVVEAQLAHGKSGPLGAAYDRAEFMEQRRELMQTWADYLDAIQRGAEVIPIRSAVA